MKNRKVNTWTSRYFDNNGWVGGSKAGYISEGFIVRDDGRNNLLFRCVRAQDRQREQGGVSDQSIECCRPMY